MKKAFLIILFASFCLLQGFTQGTTVNKSEQAKNNSKIVVTGYVLSKGNVPFVFPVIRGDDENEYVIVCTEKQKRKLLNLQGRHLRFTLVQKDQTSYVLKKYKKIK